MTNARVDAALVDSLFASLPIGLVAQPLSAALIVVLLFASAPHLALFVWLGAFVVISAARGLLWRRYQQTAPAKRDSRLWNLCFAPGAWVSGLVWGVALPTFSPYLSDDQQVLVVIVIVGAAAAGLATLSWSRLAVCGYLIAMLVPTGLNYVLQRHNLPIFVLDLIFLSAMLLAGSHFHRILERTLRLGFRNEVLAENLTRANRAAAAASQAKSEFLAHMSHELRTPLNAVIGFSEIMAHELFGPHGAPQYKEYSALIHRSGQYLLDLIGDILDLSKAEAGQLELQEDIIDLDQVIDETAALIGPTMDANGVTLARPDAQGFPLVRADRRKIRQILFNLLSNAAKFTPAGGAVRIGLDRADNGDVLIEVADNGIGIAPEHLERALTPFMQIDGPFNRRHQGTGLGLPLTKRLTELHGGALRIDSALGKGTRVTVRLPARRAIARAGADASEPPSAVA